MTQDVRERFLKTNWEAIAEENRKNYREVPAEMRRFYVQTKTNNGLTAMSNNMNISTLLPNRTRFLFIKKLIVRIMRVTTRHQQEFNTATWQTCKTLVTAMTQMEKQIVHLQHMVADQQEIIETLKTEFSQK